MFRLWIRTMLVLLVLGTMHLGCSTAPPGPCDSITCDAGKKCKQGVCVDECTAEQAQCGSTCHNTKSDNDHCGACFNKCRTDEVCTDSKCVLTCKDGKSACGSSCVDTKSSVLHCGACGTACKDGEVCKDGKCEIYCPEGTSLCDGKCVDTTASTAHCGACGTACKAGEICKAGKCESSCAQGLTECSGQCYNTKTSRAHCGACGTACKAGEICKDGKCEFNCPQGQVECSGQCVDTDSNRAHCGACDKACANGQVCSSGACKASCTQNQTECSGACVDLQTSTAHCGACGTACKSGQACLAGACVAACQDNETNCSGVCANLQTDANNCSACGQACKTGLGCCGATCLDLQTDVKNCGTCGTTCTGGKVCAKGACACKTGETECSGTCANLKTSNDNCGACGTACSNGKVCVDGTCKLGWAISAGGRTKDSNERIYRVSVDSNGNVYALGTFGLEMTVGSTTLNTKGTGQGLFVAKFNSQLQPQWIAKGESRGFNSWGLKHDANGNVYISGVFYTRTIRLGSFTLTNVGSGDVFVAKLDNTGKWKWATRGGGKGDEYAYGLSLDGSGNIYITGGIYSINANVSTFGSSTFKTQNTDVFVAKLNSTGAWQWAKTATGSSSETAYAIKTDASGNSHITGYFRSNTSFGSSTITSKGSNDVFVAKINSSGVWQWATGAGSNSSDRPYDIALDSSGNSYVTGRYYNTGTFGSFKATAKGSEDIFVGKVDKNGAWQWVASAGGSRSDYGYGVEVDSSGNVYTTGYFYGSVNFGSTSFSIGNQFDIFVAKLNSTGAWQWAKSAGGAKSSTGTTSDYGRSVGVDSSGNVYVGGYFYADSTFGSTTVTSKGRSDMFITKLTSSGAFTNTVTYGGISSDYDYAYDIAKDSQGNFYITGVYEGVMALGTTTLTSRGTSRDIYVAKIDPIGNWLWAKSAGSDGGSSNYGYGVAVDGNDNVYITGYYYARTDEKVAFGTTIFTGKNSTRLYVAKLDKSGAWQWAKDAGAGTDSVVGWGVAVDKSDNVFVTGYFYRSCEFGSLTLTGKGTNNDVFVAKMDKSGNWLWAKSAGSTNFDYAYRIRVDANGDAYLAGTVYNGATFGSLTYKGSNNRELFVAKIDSKGDWKWVSGGGGSSSDYAYDLALDSSGNVYTTGYFYNTATFGTFTMTSAGSADIFLGKMDKNGKWLWVKQAGGKTADYGYGIDVDASGNVYATGFFPQEASFGTTTFSSAQQTCNIYVTRLDTNGKWLGTKAATSGNSFGGGHEGRAIVAGKNGNSYVAGYFDGATKAGNNNLVAEGGSDILVWLALP